MKHSLNFDFYQVLYQTLYQAIYKVKEAYLSLKQKPGFVFSVVTTMGITLGALLCVLTLAYVMLLKPLPYPEQDKLYVVESKIHGNERAPKISVYPYPALVNLYKKQSVLDKVAMIAYEITNITSHAEQPRVHSTFVSPEYFDLLNPPMALGRKFEASEALNTNNPVAIISFSAWLQLYNQQLDVLEQSLTINEVSYRIVGVSAETFIEPSLYETGIETQVWLPWDFNFVPQRRRNAWGNFAPNMFLLGKLDNNLTTKQAEMMLTPQLTERWQQELVGNARFEKMSLVVELKSLIRVISGNDQTNLTLLFLAIIGLLLIAISNVSHLFVARSAEKQHQTAIKISMGMNRRQGFMLVFNEIFLLMFLAFFIAMATANIGFVILHTYLTELFNRVDELVLSIMPITILIVAMILLSLILAKLSYKKINIKQLNGQLQNCNKGQGAKISRLFQQTTITCQILVTVLILFANMVLFKQAYVDINQETGFEIEQVQRLVLAYNGGGRPKATEQRALYSQLKAELLAMPMVKAVSLGSSPLFISSVRPYFLGEDSREQLLEQKDIDAKYFSMINQSLIAGDDFSVDEVSNGENVVIVNESLAQYLTQFGSVIGQKIKNSRDEVLIVKGIVADIKLAKTGYTRDKKASNNYLIYRPTILGRGTGVMVQLVDGQTLARAQLAQLITQINGKYSIDEYQSLNNSYQHSLINQKVTLFTTGALTLVVLGLAALGLFGVLDFNTRIRRFEIATRMAIGAKGSTIIRLIFKDNAHGIIFGIMISIVVLLAIHARFGQKLNPYLSLQELPLFILTLGLIAFISLIACYLPLRQYIKNPVIHSLKGNE